ncbi:MAG: polymorphic toxin type 46 domain-containing protein [Oleiphilus sp.]
MRESSKGWPAEKKARFDTADNFYKQAGYVDYDSHLRGIDFDEPVEVVKLQRTDKLYQYSYLDRVTGKPKVGSYYYTDKSVDVNKLGFEVGNRKMIELEIGESSDFLRSQAANIEDWNGSGQIFTGGETQLFNPNVTLLNVGVIK